MDSHDGDKAWEPFLPHKSYLQSKASNAYVRHREGLFIQDGALESLTN